MENETKNEIIIEFIETETSKLDNKDSIKTINLTGEISVINPSSSRVWNAKLILSGTDTTNLEKIEYQINELKPGNKWMHAYSMIEDFIREPVFTISEKIDTYYESENENWAGILGKRSPTSFTLIAENKIDVPIKNVVITKKMPSYFSEPILDESNIFGSLAYNAETRELLWKIDEIAPKQKMEVEIRTAFTPETPEPHGAGELEASYEVDGIIRTSLDAKMYAQTDNLFAVDVGESMDTPGNWECTAEFENSSSLNVTLNKIKVLQIKPNVQELVVEEEPNVTIEIGNSWSKDFEVKSDSVPKFKKEYDFSVNYVIRKKIIGKIYRDENIIPIAAIELTKTTEPPEILANTKTDVNITITVKNVGSAVLNEFIIKDVIPMHFKPPEVGTIEYFIDTKEIRDGVSFELTPNNDDPNEEHTITHKITNLVNLIDGFKPESQLIIKYPIHAWNPPPKKDYISSIKVSANVEPPGPPIVAENPDFKIAIKYARRRIRAYKQIQPLEEEGHYRIPVFFQNKGEISLENIVIKDFIPKNFELLNWEPEDIKPEIRDLEEGTELIWKFSEVKPNEKLQLGYTIKGTGEYVAPELEVNVE